MSENNIGIDHTGKWTPRQYAIDAGWDYSCIEATAHLGISDEDARGLTETQQAELRAFCKNQVLEPSKIMTESEAIEWVYDQDERGEIDQEDLEKAFAALYGRAPDDQDRQHGLWSLCCSATPNCGTRPE